jgi:hypothetical protein
MNQEKIPCQPEGWQGIFFVYRIDNLLFPTFLRIEPKKNQIRTKTE